MPDETLRNLAEEFWETVLEASPSTATLLGDHRYDDRLEDLSAEAEQRAAGRGGRRYGSGSRRCPEVGSTPTTW